jgi:rRNA maturation endonuclease Nob1
MRLRRIVSLSVKVCRACHRLAPPDSITCPRCGRFDLTAIRCRVDKLDLEDYYRAFPKR